MFAIVDIVLAVLAGGYAVYDIRTDTGWFAGLLGALIMFMGMPVFAVLLLGDWVVWLVNRKRNR